MKVLCNLMLWSHSTQNVVDRSWMVYLRLFTSLQGNRKQKLLVAILCFNYILQNVDSNGIKMIIIIIIITLKNFFTTDWLKSTGLKRHSFQYICYYVYIILNLVKFLYIYLVNKYMYVKKFGQCIWTGRYKYYYIYISRYKYYYWKFTFNNNFWRVWFFITDGLKSTGLKRHCFQYICYYVYIYIYLLIPIHTYIYLFIRYIYIHNILQQSWNFNKNEVLIVKHICRIYVLLFNPQNSSRNLLQWLSLIHKEMSVI